MLRRVTRRIVPYAVAFGILGAGVWYTRGFPGRAIGVLALTTLLLALFAYNERYGTPLY